MSTSTENKSVDTRAVPAPPLWKRVLKTRATAVLILDLILFVIFTLTSPDHVFATSESLKALFIAATEALLLAVGLTLLLGAGIFDLSLGANLVLSSVAGAMVIKHISPASKDFSQWNHVGQSTALAVIVCILTGAAFGAVNGLLVAYVRINALIATLATLGIGTGIAYVMTSGSDISGLPPVLQEKFGLHAIGAFPIPALIAIGATLILFIVMRFTRFGMRTLAIGSSEISATRAGIGVPSHLMKLTILAGALAGVAGFIDITRFASTAISGHSNDALNAVTAAVIGGTLLEGGRVSMLGTIWGTGLAVIVQSGLIIAGVSSYYQLIAVGVILVLAVSLDRISSAKRAGK